MKSKSLYPLFIGFGKQAQEYAKVLIKKKIKIQSVCVTDLDKKKKIFNKYKIKNRYNNIGKAINDKKYNCIFIFLPFNIIEKKILKILKMTNAPIYSEKPLALSYKKISEIDTFVKKNKKKLYILYNRNHYNIYKVLKSYSKREKFILRAYIPERINETIKKIDKNLKGNIKYHLSSHWLNFFFSLQKIKNLQPVKKDKSIFYTDKNSEILISPNDKGFITAVFKSKKYVLLLLTLEQLFIFKIKENGIKFLKHYNEFSHNNFKPGLKNLIECMLKKKLKTNVTEIKILYKSLKNLNY